MAESFPNAKVSFGLKKKAAHKVWDGRKEQRVKGTVEALLLDGVQPLYSNSTSYIDDEPIKDAPVMIFHSGRRWWLCYGRDYCTGGFKTKKEAAGWYVHGGR